MLSLLEITPPFLNIYLYHKVNFIDIAGLTLGYSLYWCQLIVIGINSTPTGILNLGCGEEEILFSVNSSIVIQHGHENSMAVEQLNSVTA